MICGGKKSKFNVINELKSFFVPARLADFDWLTAKISFAQFLLSFKYFLLNLLQIHLNLKPEFESNEFCYDHFGSWFEFFYVSLGFCPFTQLTNFQARKPSNFFWKSGTVWLFDFVHHIQKHKKVVYEIFIDLQSKLRERNWQYEVIRSCAKLCNSLNSIKWFYMLFKCLSIFQCFFNWTNSQTIMQRGIKSCWTLSLVPQTIHFCAIMVIFSLVNCFTTSTNV